MAIVSASEYKTWRGISASTWDALIAVLIAGAQKRVEKFCGRVFDTATFTEYYDGNDTDTLVLRNTPIASVTSVTLTTASGSSSTLSSSTYRFRAETGELQLESGYAARFDRLDDMEAAPAWNRRAVFPMGLRNVTVVYVGAYGSPQPAMPDDLKLAFYQYLDELWAKCPGVASGGGGGATPTGFSAERLGDYSYELAGDGGFVTFGNGQTLSLEFARMKELFGGYRRGYTL